MREAAERRFDLLHIKEVLSSGQFNQLLELFRKYSPTYCFDCAQTGTVVNVVCHPSKPPEISTSECRCASFKRFNQSIEQKCEGAGIPCRYRQADVSNWKSTSSNKDEDAVNAKAIQIISSYADKIGAMFRKGYGLFLCGPNGVGKTYLACAVARKSIIAGYRVKYYTMSKIVRSVVDGWYDGEQKIIVKDIETADFLVIDDVDKAYQTRTKLEVSVLDNLFRERVQSDRPTIMTSNKTPEQIKETHGLSIASMLSEHCAVCVIVGGDYRKRLSENIVKDILDS